MSNVVTPRGPLPPRVYWRRRLLMVVVVVAVAMLVGRLFTGGDDTTPTAGDAEPTPTASAQPTGSPTETRVPQSGGGDNARGDKARKGQDGRRDRRQRRRDRDRSQRPSRVTSSLAEPVGACEVSDVVIVPDVEDTDALDVVPLRLGLSSMKSQACRFEFGPDSVALQITSGDDLIWQSVSCRRVLEEQSVVVRAGWLTYVTVDWSGRRGAEGCGRASDFAEPGYYWVEAAPIGGEPHRSQFELEKPPPPPSKKPSATPSGEPSATPSGEPSESPSGEPSESPSEGPSEKPSGTPSEKPSGEPTSDAPR